MLGCLGCLVRREMLRVVVSHEFVRALRLGFLGLLDYLIPRFRFTFARPTSGRKFKLFIVRVVFRGRARVVSGRFQFLIARVSKFAARFPLYHFITSVCPPMCDGFVARFVVL